jgi:hypothetical protein
MLCGISFASTLFVAWCLLVWGTGEALSVYPKNILNRMNRL